MPLKTLFCDSNGVTDLTPLSGMAITSITFSPQAIKKGIEALRAMRSLASIGLLRGYETWKPDDFWKKYDAGEFNK